MILGLRPLLTQDQSACLALRDENRFPKVFTKLRVLDLRFKALISRVRACAIDLKSPRVVMRVLWSLGKVGASGTDVAAIVCANILWTTVWSEA